MIDFSAMISPFMEFSFMRRALVGAVAVSFSSAPVGVFLLLRRMTLTGDAMAHAILPGAAIGYAIAGLSLPAMSIGGMLAGFCVALVSAAIARVTPLREDASLAAFYLLSLALGVVLVSSKGSNIDLLHVLFGSALALDNATLLFLASLASLTLIGLAIIFRPLVIETCDPHFLKSVSKWGPATQLIFLSLVAMNLVAGFQALGTLLAVGMMVLPAASARLWSPGLLATLLVAIGVSLLASYVGLLLSYYQNVPVGPAMTLTAGGIYIFSLFFGRHGGLLRNWPKRVHLSK